MDMGTGLQIPFCEIKVQRGRALLEATQHKGGRISEPGMALMEHVSGCTCQGGGGRREGSQMGREPAPCGNVPGTASVPERPWPHGGGCGGVRGWEGAGPRLSPLPSLATHLKAL